MLQFFYKFDYIWILQFMSRKFHKYEKKLLREYLNTLRDIKTSDSNCENDIQLD